MKNYELAKIDYSNGLLIKEIADKYNVSVATVRKWKSRYKWDNVTKKCDKSVTKKSKEIEEKKKGNTAIKEIEEDDGITDKQRLFCYYYMQSFNAYQSAIKAGYSEGFARTHVYKMLANDSIKIFLNKLKEEQKAEFFLSQERLLNRHTQIAFSDVNDIVNLDGTLKEGADGTLIKKITVKSSKSEDDNGYKESSTVAIEMEDRKESLKFLTKYLGLDKEEEGKSNPKLLE